jgi:hypothetical protein
MDPRYVMLKLQQCGRYIDWHANRWLETAIEQDEDRHRKSIVLLAQRIDALLQNRDFTCPEPWLTLVEIQQRRIDCDVDPSLKI